MGFAYEELLSLLREQKNIYHELVELSHRKQRLLIEGELTSLELITKQEEMLIYQAGKLEEKREKCVVQLAEEGGFDTNITLKELLPHVPENTRVDLIEVYDDFFVLFKDLEKYNRENTDLIQQSLRFVNFSVDTLSGQTKPIYNPDKEVNVERLTNLVDKKV